MLNCILHVFQYNEMHSEHQPKKPRLMRRRRNLKGWRCEGIRAIEKGGSESCTNTVGEKECESWSLHRLEFECSLCHLC